MVERIIVGLSLMLNSRGIQTGMDRIDRMQITD
jgi:hypothetical protein